jgi:hypothetical protein
MLFADDVVLVDKTRVGVNGKLELWKDSPEFVSDLVYQD